MKCSNGNNPLKSQSGERVYMEGRDSASSALRESNSGAPSSDSDGPSPTRSGVSGERGTMLSDVYGFMGSITVVVAVGIFMIWAYVPEYWLQYIGINYYPNRYWELGVPSYVSVMIVVAIVIYTGISFLATPPPTSLKLIFDEYSEDILSGIPLTEDGEPLPEIGTDQVNQLFNDLYS